MNKFEPAFPIAFMRPGQVTGTAELIANGGISARLYVATALLATDFPVFEPKSTDDTFASRARRALQAADALLDVNQADEEAEKERRKLMDTGGPRLVT